MPVNRASTPGPTVTVNRTLRGGLLELASELVFPRAGAGDLSLVTHNEERGLGLVVRMAKVGAKKFAQAYGAGFLYATVRGIVTGEGSGHTVSERLELIATSILRGPITAAATAAEQGFFIAEDLGAGISRFVVREATRPFPGIVRAFGADAGQAPVMEEVHFDLTNAQTRQWIFNHWNEFQHGASLLADAQAHEQAAVQAARRTAVQTARQHQGVAASQPAFKNPDP